MMAVRSRRPNDPARRALAKWLFACVAGRALAAHALGDAGAGGAVRPDARLGINIAGVVWYNTELPFVDQFRMAGDWSRKAIHPAPGSPAILPVDLDADGWVKSIPAGTWAECPVAGEGRIPLGEWTVLYDGSGRVEIWGTVAQIRQSPGWIQFNVPRHDKALIWLRLWATDPANPVRNIRVLMPGHEKTYASNPWNPTFLARWKGMAVLRFMDFMSTNNSATASWAERPRPDHATFDRRGVPVELLVDLANRMGTDPWFCMPHLADDDYVRRFAAVVRERLDPRLKVYVEYSNEVWNSIFQQHRHVARTGRGLGLARNDYEAGLRYASLRATQMFKLWEAEFHGRSRLVRVLASQAANAWTGNTMLGTGDAAAHTDALAIANYVAFMPSPRSSPSDAEVGRWSPDTLFAALELECTKQERALRDNFAVARRHGLRLIAYEGGQHLVGVLGAENNDALTDLFKAANRHPRMGELYRRLYRIWEAAGGDLFCHFSSVNPGGKWGCWGLLEHHDDDPRASPKFMESMRWAQSRGQAVSPLR